MNVEDRIVDMENMLTRLAKHVHGLRGMELNLSTISAGMLPKRLTADLESVGEAEDMEIDDEAFLSKLAEIAEERNPISGMMNLATLVARLKAASVRLEERAEKLAEREGIGGGDAEASAAASLRAKVLEAKNVVEARMSATLTRFFMFRLYAINATLKLTERVCRLWKDGSAEMRTAALNSSAAQAIASLGEWERLAVQGAFKMGSSAGKGTVKI